MSLSNNLNDAPSMSLPGNPTNMQMEEEAGKFKFPFWKPTAWSGKFPSGKQVDLKLLKSKELSTKSTPMSHSSMSKNLLSVENLHEFPLKSPKHQQSKFPLSQPEVVLMTKETTEIVKNTLALTEVRNAKNNVSFPKSEQKKSAKFPTHTKIFENALSELTNQIEIFNNANRSRFDQLVISDATQLPTKARARECAAVVQKFPIIKKQFFNFPIGREERVINAKEMTFVLVAWGKANAEIMKIHNERQNDDEYNNNPNNNNNIKYMNECEEYPLLDQAMQAIHGHALNLNAQNNRICADDDDDDDGDGDGGEDETNMTAGRRCENADDDDDDDGNNMVKSKIKHQQAENFNDALKTIDVDDDDDAMNLLKFKNKAKNTTTTIKTTTCEQNSKILPEIFKRDEEKHKNMTKAKSSTTTTTKAATIIRTSTTTTPTLSKILANQEQPKQSTEHSFHINELNTNNNNNNGEYKQPDNNNNNHPQQSLAKQSETQPKNPKLSDVREPSSGQAEQELSAPPHEEGVALNARNFIKTTSPLVAAKTVGAATTTTPTTVDDIDVGGVRFGNASSSSSSLATVTSLALCVSTTYDERSAVVDDEPNIEKSPKSNNRVLLVDVDDDDNLDDYVACVDDVNDYVDVDVESKCADILTDVIDLIEQTTCAIIITGNLLADVRVVRKEDEDGLPEVSVRLPEAMTVTKVNGQAIGDDHDDVVDDVDVCAEREQKLLNDTSTVVDELDEMKFEMKRVKGSLPTGRNARATNANDKQNFVASTARMSDISAVTAVRKHDVQTPAAYGATRLQELATKRESLTRMHDSSTSSLTGASGRLTPLSPTLEAVSPTAAALSRTTSLDLKRVPTQDSVDSVLPERTLLRRQKRMRSVGSVEEKPEDVIERLNKLKARISGALSEVKSVIKQYSTESEADAASELSNEKLDKKVVEPKSDDKEADGKIEEAPVQFRFVRKVRRRSVFNEEDEYNAAEEEAAKDLVDKKEPKEESKAAEASTKQNGEIKSKTEVKEDAGEASKKNLKTNGEVKAVDEGVKKKLSTTAEANEKSVKENGEIKSQAEAVKENGDDDLKEKLNRPTATPEAAKPSLMDFIEVKSFDQPEERVKSKLEFLHKVAQELYKKPSSKTATTSKDNLPEKAEKQEAKVEQAKTELPKPTTDATPEAEKLPIVTEEAATKAKATTSKNVDALPPAHPTTAEEAAKPKKKIVVHKVKTTTKPRRASIAAVEESKIEPPVQSTLALSIKTQRRPSDSEAIVKKKTSSNKLAMTSAAVNGDDDELLPKGKLITKVKRASIKGVTTSTETAASNQEQDKIQLKVKEGIEQATMPTLTLTPATQKSVAKSKDNSNNNKTEDVGDKSANNSNKDVVGVPSQTTTLVTEAQPKQLKIDSVVAGDAVGVAVGDDVTVAPCDKAPKDNANVAATNESTTKATLDKRQEASASPLSASKVNGQIERISDKLAELVGETIIIVPVQDTLLTSATRQIQATQNEKLTKDASDSKEPIHQTADIKIPTHSAQNEVNKQTPVSSSESTQAEQQVAASESNEINVAAAVAIGIDAAASKSDGDAEPQIANESLSACDTKTRNDATVAAKEEATKVDATAAATTSVAAHTDVETSQQQQHSTAVAAATTEEQKSDKAKPSDGNAMPELKVSAGPVQPVKLGIDGATSEAVPFDVVATHADDAFHAQKKKVMVRKIVRKNSIDHVKEKADAAKLNNLLKDKHKISNMTAVLNKNAPPKKQTTKETKSKDAAVVQKDEKCEETQKEAPTEGVDLEVKALEAEPEEPPAPAIKKPRQIKKKVIIKRQKRRLSIGDTFFIQQEEEPKVPEIEVIEKAIAYVTDDEAEDIEPVESKDETDGKPLKTCLHLREYKVGELVLYAERFRKTQVKWKRGRVLERITSISYKLDVEGKEVAAHVSYIKKWTGRKVNFGIKEYLEIDYEQVVEEERRARSYSIWNMV